MIVWVILAITIKIFYILHKKKGKVLLTKLDAEGKMRIQQAQIKLLQNFKF